MSKDDIIRMAREAGWRESFTPPVAVYRFFQLAHAAGEQAERDRTKGLVEAMQAELQALRDRLAKQKVRMWVLKDNPGISTMSEPSEKALWEPLGPIV